MDFDKLFQQRFGEPPAGQPPASDLASPAEFAAPGEPGDPDLVTLAEFLTERERSQCHRRGFLKGGATGLLLGGAAGLLAGAAAAGYSLWKQQPPPLAGLALPGKYRGKVVEVHHAGAVYQSRRDRGIVRKMMDRGMIDLVGSTDAVEAWRSMFSPGDRVGIKVVPVGQPLSISSHEVVLETIEGLRSAGVRLRDILIFERYKDDFMTCNYQSTAPDGVYWECSSVTYDDDQLELDGQLPRDPKKSHSGKESHVAGYDRDVYLELPYCTPTADSTDDRRYRSHVSKIITQKVDKFISIPVLKDHRSAGVTLSLKNLSHGSVNNVARSHIGHTYKTHDSHTLNQCGTFIPQAVSLQPIREKAVLQILDGLVGTYEGGPGNWNSTFATWEYNSLFFATDPVALDHVGWSIIDAKRAALGLPRVAEMGTDAFAGLKEPRPEKSTEQFHIRQPQHVPLAGLAGLGEFDLNKINHVRHSLTG